MPALTTALLFSVGPSVAKALLAAMLNDYPVIKDLAPDLLEMLRDKAKGKREQREAGDRLGAVGEHVAAQLRPVFADARLNNEDRVAVLRELLITLRQTDAEQVLESRVDSRRLADVLLAHRPDATTTLTARQTDIYKRAISSASQAIIPIAAELHGYASLRDAELLHGQDASAERDERMIAVLEALLRQPEQDIARFEQMYRDAIKENLDKLELIGVRRLNQALRRQRLNVAYVTVEVENRASARGDDVSKVLHQAVAEAGRTAAAEGEASGAGPIDTVLATERRIVVRGDPGSGKTTLLQWIAVKSAGRDFRGALSLWNNAVPFFIRLREAAAQGFPRPEEYVLKVDPDLAGRCPSEDWAHLQLDNGRAVLLIDGVDELPAGKREAFLERLQRLVRRHPNARYIVTSRPAAVSAKNWPEWHEWMREAGFAEVAIKEMSRSAINTFIDQWHSAYDRASDDPAERAKLPVAAAHLKGRLDAQAGMRRLAGNPLLCSMICALHLEQQNTLPSERIELYRECINMLLEQRDTGREVSHEDYPKLNSSQWLELLEDLAFRMMRGDEIEIDRETAENQFRQFLPRQGLADTKPDRVLAFLLERAGLLREPADGMIDFPHRSFQEYFTARAIADAAEVGFLLAKAGEESWRETIALAAGANMLPQKRREELLRGLLYRPEPQKASKGFLQNLLGGKQRKPEPAEPPTANTPPGHRALALACLETAGNIDPVLREEIFRAAEALFPPYTAEQQHLVAAAGEHAIPYLVAERQPNIAAGAACIATLARIGGDKALAAIESYLPAQHRAIENAIDEAWPSFDYRRFAQRLLQGRTRARMYDPALLAFLSELPQLTDLDLSRTPVSDLSALTHVPQLTKLDLSGTPVSDLSLLAHVPQLTKLILNNTQVSDLSALAHVPQLTELILNNTQVSDLSALTHVPQLTKLDLNDTQVSDLSALGHVPQLTNLYLWNTPVRDLSALAHVPQLTELILGGTPVRDLSALAHVPQLTELFLFDTIVTELSGLAHVPQLTALFILNAPVSDLSALTYVPQLTELYLSNIPPVRQLSWLAKVPQLTDLSLGELQVPESGWLAKVPQLSRLDLSWLAQVPQLTALSLNNTRVSDLSSLKELTQLTELNLSSTPVSDLSSLKELTQLTELHFMNTQVSNLSSLKELKELTTLNLSSTRVSDLSSLKELKELKELYLMNAPVSDLSVLKELPNLAWLRL